MTSRTRKCSEAPLSATPRAVRIETICTGDELLTGLTSDTNSRFFQEALLDRTGLTVRRGVVVGDDRADIIEALEQAVSRAEVVLVSGGLGPTSDDLDRRVRGERGGHAAGAERRGAPAHRGALQGAGHRALGQQPPPGAGAPGRGGGAQRRGQRADVHPDARPLRALLRARGAAGVPPPGGRVRGAPHRRAQAVHRGAQAGAAQDGGPAGIAPRSAGAAAGGEVPGGALRLPHPPPGESPQAAGHRRQRGRGERGAGAGGGRGPGAAGPDLLRARCRDAPRGGALGAQGAAPLPGRGRELHRRAAGRAAHLRVRRQRCLLRRRLHLPRGGQDQVGRRAGRPARPVRRGLEADRRGDGGRHPRQHRRAVGGEHHRLGRTFAEATRRTRWAPSTSASPGRTASPWRSTGFMEIASGCAAFAAATTLDLLRKRLEGSPS